MDSQRNDEALKCYSAALSIHPANTQGYLVMRSKVCMATRSWKDAIDHANEVGCIVVGLSMHIEPELGDLI